MTKEEALNVIIKEGGIDTNKISDGYHTFGELYEHRIVLFIKLCKLLNSLPGDYHTPKNAQVWKSNMHSDGTVWDGWFIMGIGVAQGHQITYHLPVSYWNECSFAETRIMPPEFDGHTSNDVLQRLKNL